MSVFFFVLFCFFLSSHLLHIEPLCVFWAIKILIEIVYVYASRMSSLTKQQCDYNIRFFILVENMVKRFLGILGKNSFWYIS